MRGATPPDGIVATSDGGGTWWIAAASLAAVRAAGWLLPARVEAALAAADAAQGRAALARVEAGAASLALRAVRHGGVFARALGGALGGPARPLAEIAANVRLAARGAPVPRPAFAGAWRHGIVWHGVVATHWEDGAADGERFLGSAPPPARIAAAIAAAAHAIRRFHDAGGSHPDLHAKNLLLRARDDAFEALVIDLDGARVESEVSSRRRMEQLMRLYRSLVKRGLLAAIGPRGADAFLDAYANGDTALRRALLARLPAERRRIARHALLYRGR
jgi:hypothetical protein